MGSPAYANDFGTETALARRERLVMEHLPQVRIIAGRIWDRLPSHVSLDDLISSGVVGLLSAIDNFEPSFNVQLKTYAEHRIHGAIMDSLRNLDWAPRETRKRSRQIEAGIRNLRQRLGREPSEEEVAGELKITQAELQQWLTDARSVEIHQLEVVPGGGGEAFDLLSIISNDESEWPSQVVERAELERILTQAIERMPKQERTVLSLYYFEELNLREISEVMGLHLSRIGQLRVQAILRLRSHMERVWSNNARSRR
jgi:RNA polymerase sigma factor for flagellar operon FliA